MKILSQLFGGATPGKQAVAKTPQSLIVEAKVPLPAHKRMLATLGLRRGMWIVADDSKVGIVTDLLPNGVNEDTRPQVKVAFVDELGVTIGYAVVLPRQLRQAAFKDIPEPRRPEREAAANLGYRT